MFECVFIVSKNMVRRSFGGIRIADQVDGLPFCHLYPLFLWPSSSSSPMAFGDPTLHPETTRRHTDYSFHSPT